MRTILTLCLALSILPVTAFSQSEISGTVVDAESGETLPSATILLEESYRGTITNPEGRFSISVEGFPVILTVRYIGYQTKRVEVIDESELPVTVRLLPSVTELDEIVVTGRDPGLSIMERVIERKKIWRADLQNYRVEAYTRQVLENDTSIVSITESNSIAYWDHEKGHREVLFSTRQTSNVTEDQNFAGVSYLPNFYDDNIEIAGYSIIGITHPNALRYYHFTLLETLQMDGKPVYKIVVTPRRQRQPTFEGIAYVLGRDYALIEVDLKPNDVVSFPPPVQDFDLSYKQQFSNYGGDFWLPVDMRTVGTIRIGMVGLRFPTMNFRQSSRLSGYEVNISIPDSVYEKRTVLSRAETDTLISFREVDQIPLTREESEAYETIDSTQTLEQAFRPEGFLARMIENDDDQQSTGFLRSLGRFTPKGLGIKGRFNRIDGFHLGLKYENRFRSAGLHLKGFSGYSFHSELWDYGISADQRVFRVGATGVSLLAGYEQVTDSRYQSQIYSIGQNSISSLIGNEDYFDYYRNKKIYGGIGFRNFLPGTDLTITGNRETHTSFEPGSEYDYSLFGMHRTRRENRQIEEGRLQSLKAELGYNVSPSTFGFSGRRSVRFNGEWSSPSIGSDFEFVKIGVSLDWNVETFYQRRLFANTLDLHLSAGRSFGNLPLQRFGAVDGSLSRFTPFGTLKTRNFIPYEGNRYWLATGEHNFRTIPFELAGLHGLADRGWSIILFGGAGYAEANGDYPDGLFVSSGVHSELGLSLNSIFGILRIDFAKRLDSPGSFIGFSVPRYF